jgi:hypothetical protein
VQITHSTIINFVIGRAETSVDGASPSHFTYTKDRHEYIPCFATIGGRFGGCQLPQPSTMKSKRLEGVLTSNMKIFYLSGQNMVDDHTFFCSANCKTRDIPI